MSALRPAQMGSLYSINGECQAEILVQVRYHSNRLCLIDFVCFSSLGSHSQTQTQG